jgi:hypothetical protein
MTELCTGLSPGFGDGRKRKRNFWELILAANLRFIGSRLPRRERFTSVNIHRDAITAAIDIGGGNSEADRFVGVGNQGHRDRSFRFYASELPFCRGISEAGNHGMGTIPDILTYPLMCDQRLGASDRCKRYKICRRNWLPSGWLR